MNKKTVFLILIILIIALPVFAFGSSESNKKTEEKESPVKETVISTPITSEPDTTSLSTPIYKVELASAEYITQEDLDDTRDALSSYYGEQISEEEALEYLIDQIIFNQALTRALENGEIPIDDAFNEYVTYQLALYARYNGITLTTEEEANAFLAQLGVSYTDFANQILQEYAQNYYVQLHSDGKLENIPNPSREDIEKVYKDNINTFVSEDTIYLAHIYFAYGSDKEAAKVRANTASNNLDKGLSWKDAVTTYSDDATTSKNNGEFGMWLVESDPSIADAFGEEAVKVMFGLAKDEISDVVEGLSGYHILKVIDRRNACLLGLDDLIDLNYNITVADYISEQIMSQTQQALYAEVLNEIMSSLKEEAIIKSLK